MRLILEVIPDELRELIQRLDLGARAVPPKEQSIPSFSPSERDEPATTNVRRTVFVCGPSLSGEAVSHITVRDGAVVWEGDAGPAPHPREEISAAHYVPVESGLVLLETEAGLYLASAADLPGYQTLLVPKAPQQDAPAASEESRDERE